MAYTADSLYHWLQSGCTAAWEQYIQMVTEPLVQWATGLLLYMNRVGFHHAQALILHQVLTHSSISNNENNGHN